MSTDWFLFSPSHKREAMVGSDGLSGVKSWPGHVDVIEFVRWAIENDVKDIVLLNEHDPRLDYDYDEANP